MVVGVLAFVIGLFVSVMLHEAGHLVTAKRFGMKATEYFVGFGPRLWSFRRGETEYGVKAIPAGGYVKILGMAPEENVAEEDRPRAFYRKPAWQRAIVLAAGSFTHFVIAFVLLFVLAVGFGVPTQTPSLTVSNVSSCVPDAARAQCDPSDPPSPAAQAGVMAGDRIVALSGQPAGSWTELSTAISQHGTGQTTLTVLRDGKRVVLQADLARNPQGGGFLGVSPAPVYDRYGPVGSLVFAGEAFGQAMVGTAKAIAAIPSTVPTLFSAERGPSSGGDGGGGLASVVGVAQLSGEFFAEGDSWNRAVGAFFGIMVAVNISVGVINLLPLLPLDGGHLAVLGFQRARAGLYRLVGRADPGPVDMNRLLPLTAAFLVLIIGFGLMLIMADILNPIRLS